MYKIKRDEMTIEFDNKNYVCSEKDLGTADVDHNTIKSYGQQGTVITYSSLNQREISITGYILATNKEDMRDKKNKLNVITNPLNDFEFIINDEYKLLCRLNSTISFSQNHSENNNNICMFMMNATCSMPYFIGTEDINFRSNSVKNNFTFPIIIPTEKPIHMGYQVDTDILRVNNVSDVEVGCIITISATTTITTPKIENMVTGEYIQFDCNIPANYKIVVDTNYKKKTATMITASGVENNILQFYNYNSSFLQLGIGDNYFKFSHSSGYNDMSINVEYTPSYLTI